MRRASVTVCLLILLGLGAWLLRPSDDALRSDGGREDLERTAYTPDATLVGTKTEQPGETKPDVPAVEVPAVDASPQDGETPGARILLKGTLRVEGGVGVQPLDPPAILAIREQMMIFDSFRGFRSLKRELAESGAFEIDMTTPLTEMSKRHSHGTLTISLRHPGYMPLDRRVPVSDLKAVVAGTATLAPLELTLQPAGVLRGQVVDAQDVPVAKASALLYRLIDGEPESVPVSISKSGSDGRFALPFTHDGPYLVVAVVPDHEWPEVRTVPRLLPGSKRVDLSRRTGGERVRLVQRTGYSLRGAIILDGTAPIRARVAWDLVGPAKRLRMSRDGFGVFGLAYADGQAHWGACVGRLVSGRGFELDGLSRRRYRVRVVGVEGVEIHPRARNQVEQVVTAPRDEVNFDLRPSHVRVLVRTPRGAGSGLAIGLSAVGMVPGLPEGVVWGNTSATTDSRGKVQFALQPDAEWAITVRDPRYEVVYHAVVSPAAGATTEVELELVEIKTKPSLVVSLEGRGVDALHGASFGASAAGDDGAATDPQILRNFVRADRGQYKLPNVTAGPWRLHVRPNRRWNDPPTTWLDAVVEVEVSATGETAVRVPLSRGGRVHLDVTDPGGRYVKAKCVLRDPTGNPLQVMFLSENDYGGKTLARGTLPGSHDCWISQALPAGTYTLEFTLDGHRPVNRQIGVRKGGTTTVQFVMAPLR